MDPVREGALCGAQRERSPYMDSGSPAARSESRTWSRALTFVLTKLILLFIFNTTFYE